MIKRLAILTVGIGCICGMGSQRGMAQPSAREPARPAARSAAAREPASPPAVRPVPTSGPRETAPVAPRPVVPGAASAPVEQKSYAVKLRQLAERVSTLKELVSQTKIRLNLLKESVLGQTTAGSELAIVQDNRMGSSFRLLAYRYLLDGKQIDAKTDLTGKASARGINQIYNGPALDGVHILTVEFVFRGHGFGVFSYLKGYRYRVRSSDRFKVVVGTGTTIHVVPFERGSAFTPLKQRLSVRYEKKMATLTVKRDRKGRPRTVPPKSAP